MPYKNNPTAKMGTAYHMESAKQERKDLLKDNPVVRDMDSSRPWMSKHFQSTMGSALKAGHESPMEAGHTSPMETGHTGDSPAEKELSAKQEAAFGGGKNPGLKAAIEAAPEMNMRDGMPKTYDSGLEKHCMGPRMSALENEGETGMSKEEMEKNKPDAPKPPKVDPSQAVMIAGTGGAGLAAQKLGKIVKKIGKKPVKKS